ncbi:MAG: ATP-grasp ribosomal peptide maturase [Pseudonocardiaceae bacterium]
MTVLIVTQELDATADEVVLALADRGVPVFRIDRAWFPQRLTLEAEFRDGRWTGCLRTAERCVELGDIQSVWYRWRSTFVLSPQLSPQDRRHAEREACTGFDGVVCSLDARHVNHPHRVAALPKPVELRLAARCGLDVPQTVISNSSRQVRAFANGSHEVVRKLFSCHVLDDTGRSMIGHTRLITDDDLTDLDHVALTAHQVQCYVDKLMDVRVVVVGDRMFPVAIHPLSEAARIDFRTDYRALRHEVIELPGGVAQGIRRFMAESGLLMASMDFSVGRDGRYYFLESNPAGGQYGWLEAKTGVRITEAVADLLAQDWMRSS